jgi:hypothetical protein
MPTLSTIGDFALFKPNEPYLYTTQIRDYSVDLTGTVAALEFRWSTDDQTYSAWIELTMDNLRDVILDPANKLYIEFRATLVSGGPVTVDNFQLSIEQTAVDPYAGYTPPVIDCAESGNVTSVTTIQNLCWDPYDVNPAVCLYNELSYMVNNLFGHNTEYFRAVPNKSAQDITLREYTLYDVSPAQCVKVLVENNEFPDSKLNFNPFGIEFEQPFEVHIDKRYWEEIMGHDTAPQKNDILYFPLNGRIYEVLSTYLFKAFMERDSYWKVSLIKYQPKSNRYEPDGVRELLDDLTTDTSELFEEELRDQEEQLTKPQQYNRNIGSREYDPSREALNENIQVIEEQIQNYSIVLAEFYYRLNNLVKLNQAEQDVAVQYREPVTFTAAEERSYSAWFKGLAPAFFNPTDVIDLMALNTGNNVLTIQTSQNRNHKLGEYLKIFRTGGITLYGEIINVISPSSYELQLNADVVSYLDAFNMTWSGLSSYKVEKTIPGNMIHAYDEVSQLGWKIDLMVNRYIRVTLNNKEYICPIDYDLAQDKLYGMFVNVSNKFRQVSVNVWERKWISGDPGSPQTTDLFNIYNRTINQVDPEERVPINTKYKLLASNMELTNIRVYDQTAEIEKQSLILNQNIVKDAQHAVIIDNALPILKLPFIGQSK